MDIRQLRSFVTIAERLHFREAAQMLSTAQATLTYQVQSLERDLGVRLFDRAQRKVRLTDAGAVLLVEAKRILAQIEVAQAHVVEAAHGNRGTLVIGAIPPLTLSWLPRAFAQFRSLYPDVTMRIHVLKMSGVMAALRNREIQVGFSTRIDDASEFASVPLWNHRLMVLLHGSHRAARAAEVSLRDLAGTPLISLSRKNIGPSYDRVIALCREEGLDPDPIQDVETLEELVGLVACGLGFAILPDSGDPTFGPETVSRPLASGEHGWVFESAAFWRHDESTPLVRRIIEVAVGLTSPEQQFPRSI
jgi:DNA-binding transcriptional LysR family regulator